MKSAYDIAMERLEKAKGPAKKLTDAQRTEIAEIDKKYEAQIAETRLTYEPKIAQAATPEEYEKLRGELAETISKLETKRNEEKDAVWNKE